MKPVIQQLNKKIIRSTPFGSVCLVWHLSNNLPRIVHIFLSRPGLPAEDRAGEFFPGFIKSSCEEIDATGAAIRASLEGENIKFSMNLLDMSRFTKFQLSILRAQHAIPRGSVSTYGLVAAHVGAKGAARAVGNVMAANPFPVMIPCHRTILSDHRPGGFQSGVEMKRAMLKSEGIMFDKVGRAICGPLYYSPKI